MDPAALRIRFPELKSAADATLQAVLDAAAAELNADEIGAAYNEAWALLAAHKLAVSPYGRTARMLNDKGESTYFTEFVAVLQRTVTPLTVAGGPCLIPEWPWPLT